MKENDNKLTESVISLLVRVSSLEELLINNGVLDQEKYVEEVKNKLEKMTDLLKEALEKQNKG